MPLTTSVQVRLRKAADRLHSAASSVTPVAPIRDLLGSAASDAYDVQRANIERLVRDGDRVVGRKIGLTSPAVQRLSLEAITMRLERNGVQVSAGRGSDCLGSPWHSMHWLASAMCALGEPLQAGDVVLTMGVLVGIDPQCDGLARAGRLGVATTAGGVQGLLDLHDLADFAVVFDATSAQAHVANYELLRGTGVNVIDLTPAAIGPLVVPPVPPGWTPPSPGRARGRATARSRR